MSLRNPPQLQALEIKRRSTLALLSALLLLALLGFLSLNPYAVLPLLLTLFPYWGYAREARRVLGAEAARRLGLAFSPKGELPKASLPGVGEVVAVPLLPEGEPRAHGELRGEVLGHPFRRFEVSVYGARRFGLVAPRFFGTLYGVELPRPLPALHLAPRGWPTYPGERWPFLVAFLGLSGLSLVLLVRYLMGLHVLRPGASPLLLLVFPAFFLYLLAAWRVAAREVGRRVALEGKLAKRFRAWGYAGPIAGESPLGRALLAHRRSLGPFWLRVEGMRLFLALPGGGLPATPFLFPEAALRRWEERVRGELSLLRELLLSLGDGVWK